MFDDVEAMDNVPYDTKHMFALQASFRSKGEPKEDSALGSEL